MRLRSILDPARWLAQVRLASCNHIGARVRAYGEPIVHNLGRISIGDDVIVRSLAAPVRLWTTRNGTIDVGGRVILEMGVSILSDVGVRIGDGTEIGPDVVIRDVDDAGSAEPVMIGAGVKIHARARVERGSRIGDSAVVLAESVVRGTVPAGAVVGGSPVRPGANGAAAASGSSTSIAKAPRVYPELPAIDLHGVVVADFTIDELATHFAAPSADALCMQVETAPFGQVVQTLDKLARREPKEDFVIVWTRPEQAVPSYQTLSRGGTASQERVLAEVDAFATLIKVHAGAARFVFVPSWTSRPHVRGRGALELRGDCSTAMLMRMNLRLADALAGVTNIFVFDAQRWMAAARDGGANSKLWYGGKVAFTSDVFAEAAADVRAALSGLLGRSKKLVVLDLDDTLWGGIVGDVGWEGVRLGGHDPGGEALVDFQEQLLALRRRGIALAVASKNDETTALEAMRRHPEMRIRPELLAAYRINWHDKAENLLSIANELNIGLQSIVFIDDNPVERARVREALPEVLVPEWPNDFTLYPVALEDLRCFDTPAQTAEDTERAEMYGVERERVAVRANFTSLDDWLLSLDMRVHFEPVIETNLVRTAQLLNKTNQMNLRTRRLSERELLAWARAPNHELWAVHVGDRFGDYGLTGILGLRRDGPAVGIEDYVLSCRVMGRRVEETLLWAAGKRAHLMGGTALVVEPIPTKKNKPCLDFFAGAGLTKVGDHYEWSLEVMRRPPAVVKTSGLMGT
jgi:FkbH-like protein